MKCGISVTCGSVMKVDDAHQRSLSTDILFGLVKVSLINHILIYMLVSSNYILCETAKCAEFWVHLIFSEVSNLRWRDICVDCV